MLTTTLEQAPNWARGQLDLPGDLRPRLLRDRDDVDGLARYDTARFGAEVFRASPRQADMLILSGRVSIKMVPVIRRIYDQMLEPKWVLSMGACSSSGGMFANYAVVQGADKFLPVDIHIPGCPPRPGGADLRDPEAAAEDLRRARPRAGASATRQRHRGGRARGSRARCRSAGRRAPWTDRREPSPRDAELRADRHPELRARGHDAGRRRRRRAGTTSRHS